LQNNVQTNKFNDDIVKLFGKNFEYFHTNIQRLFLKNPTFLKGDVRCNKLFESKYSLAYKIEKGE